MRPGRDFLLIALVLAGCGEVHYPAPVPSCTVQQMEDGVQVLCSGGVSGFISNGQDGAPGIAGIDGKDGTNGKDGADGQQGPKGDPGAKGDQGPQGTPGTVITPVKFCKDYQPSYPSSFPEYGICIDNKLYGVYYSTSLGAFLAYLPPGTYRSTNNSQACIFSITTGCEVSP